MKNINTKAKVPLTICILLMICFAAGTIFVNPVFPGEARKRISTLVGEASGTDDIEAEIMFGRELAARILGSYKFLDDMEINRYVNLVGKSVARYSNRPELHFYFGVLSSDDVNAFAAPGGYIFVTSAALENMENEAQLAAVLGHEIAHVTEKHVIKELSLRAHKGSAISGMASLISGTTSSIKGALEHTLDRATTILFKRGYKIEDELEADRIGIILASSAGYDPKALGNFLIRVKNFEKAEPEKEGEHPKHEVRISAINDVLAAYGLHGIKQATVRERFHATIKK